MSVLIEKIIADIIKNQLALPDFYPPQPTSKTGDKIPSVFISSQNVKLFNTDQLQVVVASVDAPKVISSSSEVNMETNPVTELQQVVMLENIQVELFSRNNDARDRRYEVIAALKSFYAKQQQDKYQFRLFEHSFSFVNAGDNDGGGSELNRWICVFPVHTIYNKTQIIPTYDYYNNFDASYTSEITNINQPSFSWHLDPTITGI